MKNKNKKMIFSSLKKNTVFKKGRFGHFIFKARARALTARRAVLAILFLKPGPGL